jgi:hypothetical protein
MKIMITQSNFLPWRGFFASVFSVDKIVFLENVQYTRRDWRNRNIIRDSLGTDKGSWISVPIVGGGSRSQLLGAAKIDHFEDFCAKFVNKFESVYQKAPYFHEVSKLFNAFDSRKGDFSLSELNIRIIKEIVCSLKINIQIDAVYEASAATDPSQRILDILLAHGGDSYLTGPSARSYLNESLFQDNEIKVSYANFSHLPNGERMMSSLGYEFSIIDTIARFGFDRTRKLTCVEV